MSESTVPKLCPREPTQAMVNAAASADAELPWLTAPYVRIWTVMFDAAPNAAPAAAPVADVRDAAITIRRLVRWLDTGQGLRLDGIELGQIAALLERLAEPPQ
jgi:hypothetical protein